jgi:flotillin
MIAEVESVVMSDLAKVQAEVAVQTARIKQVKQQLQADVIAPAAAECQQAIAKARGEAAKIIEQGKAQAEGTKKLAASWQGAGNNAKNIFLYQKLELLLKLMAASVPEVQVQTVTVVDGGDGNLVPKMTAFAEQLRQATGVDLVQMANRIAQTEPSVKGKETNFDFKQLPS